MQNLVGGGARCKRLGTSVVIGRMFYFTSAATIKQP
jgi:hypothetical protein